MLLSVRKGMDTDLFGLSRTLGVDYAAVRVRPNHTVPYLEPLSFSNFSRKPIPRFGGFGVHSSRTHVAANRYLRPEKASGMNPTKPASEVNNESAPKTTRETLSITDNRTGQQIEIPIKHDTIRAIDLRPLKVKTDDFGLMGYDPAFTNTASCQSRITFIDGDKGILRYRGYSIEELAEKSTYIETAYLLLHGELPTKSQLADWSYHVTHHTFIHESIKKFIDGFHYDAHPMGMMISTVAALSAFYPDAKDIFNPESRRKQTYRLIGKMPTLAAFAYRHSLGMPFVYPDNDLSYCGNFLNMLFRTTEAKYRPNPTLERALDILFILHADHEQNCSSTAMRVVGSSHVDPYCATAAATAALYGPLHGGANEAVLRMLVEIGSIKNVPAYIKSVKGGEKLLMGFGHRVYKNYDPRARIVKNIAYEVFDVMGTNPLIEIALECERIALEDEYFVKRKLYPNVDFYTGLIYQSMGFPMTMFPVLFAIPRTSGWIAQWEEMLLDPEQKISRPRQVYLGSDLRGYTPLDNRK
jgi:citrate synthase